MSTKLRESILKTIIYSDIFDYPLTIDEIWRFLIGDRKISKESIKREIKSCNLIRYVDKKWFLIGKTDKFIKKRLRREKESKKKYKVVGKAVRYLSYIPSIYLIGISGALAMGNASLKDDIDLFVITKNNSIFTTRLITILLLDLLGIRRKRGKQNVSNKICLNMIIDETVLSLPTQRQDLYNAHEVVQMMPLFEREDMYQNFIKANIWVKKFLPNALTYRFPLIKKQIFADSFLSIFLNFILRFSVLELLAKKLQLYFINQHKTVETVSDHLLAFHPYDYKRKILSEYAKRLKLYEKI